MDKQVKRGLQERKLKNRTKRIKEVKHIFKFLTPQFTWSFWKNIQLVYLIFGHLQLLSLFEWNKGERKDLLTLLFERLHLNRHEEF